MGFLNAVMLLALSFLKENTDEYRYTCNHLVKQSCVASSQSQTYHYVRSGGKAPGAMLLGWEEGGTEAPCLVER